MKVATVRNVIHKTSKGYVVRSKKGKNLGGPYKSRSAARKRLRQVEYFKHRGKKKSVSNKRLERINFMIGNSPSSPIRYERMDGRDYLVAPCVMLTEGVHVGSGGRGFYPAKENAKSAPSWNHKPIVVYHPEIDGQPVSACNPTILSNRRVGILLNTVHDNKLRTEAWFDIKKTNKVDDRIIKNTEAGKMTEVSTGLFLNKKKKKGKWGEEEYDWEAKDYAPDHLAILPDKVGACSIMDGAGLLQVNEKTPEILKEAYSRAVAQVTKVMNQAGEDQSFAKIMRSVELALRSKLTSKGKEWQGWIEEIFSGFVIYYAGGSLYKQTYKLTKDGVELTGEPLEVKRVVSYKTADGEPTGNATANNLVNNNKGSKTMKVKVNRQKVVNQLIGNGNWTEEDREWLMSLPAKNLMKVAKSTPKKPDQPPPVKNEKVKTKVVKPSFDEFLKSAPPEYQAMFNQGIRKFNQEKESLVKNIMESKMFSFSKEELEAKDPGELSKLMDVVRRYSESDEDSVDVNWEGAGGGAPDTNASEEETPLGLPSMDHLYVGQK